VIGSLRGVVVDRPSAGEVVVEVHGVGYRVSVTSGAFAALEPDAPTGDVLVYVHTHVREDAIVLFGFLDADERRCFEALLGAHGVGPSLALAILSSLSPAALAAAVLDDDIGVLCTVPGVGKKTAARLALELKNRLDVPLPEERGPGGGLGSSADRSAQAEVRAALVELGYGPEEIRAAVEHLPEDGAVEDLLRAALRQMARVS
jgi:Holliday junction DNA helicase RuvA